MQYFTWRLTAICASVPPLATRELPVLLILIGREKKSSNFLLLGTFGLNPSRHLQVKYIVLNLCLYAPFWSFLPFFAPLCPFMPLYAPSCPFTPLYTSLQALTCFYPFYKLSSYRDLVAGLVIDQLIYD